MTFDGALFDGGLFQSDIKQAESHEIRGAGKSRRVLKVRLAWKKKHQEFERMIRNRTR